MAILDAFKLDGNVVLVTGAAHGLGRGVTRSASLRLERISPLSTWPLWRRPWAR